MDTSFSVSGQLIDIFNRRIYPAQIRVANGKIEKIEQRQQAEEVYILPGFTDAHIHIESSMLVPSEFAKEAVKHGTVATVSDPHEIANVCGIAGVDYMIENATQTPLKIFFGAPSCVPATVFETAGATIDANGIRDLLSREEIRYLAEMMNFPGVLHNDAIVKSKIEIAHQSGKPIDGHAPGLRGKVAKQYAAAGISTDHECVQLQEALDKIEAGMLIQIREGSAARNFDDLIALLKIHPGKVMFCSDDKHPDELLKGHINLLVQRALAGGYPLFDVLHAACILPVEHYNLPVGLLREGDPADFIIADNLEQFTILQTYIDGVLVAEKGNSYIHTRPVKLINNFSTKKCKSQDFVFSVPGKQNGTKLKCRIIDAHDGQLITDSSHAWLEITEGALQPDSGQDILKIGVLNRYHEATVALGFVRNFGLKKGALASSIAHDSHNIVFVGVDDNSIASAVNSIIAHSGGISVSDGSEAHTLPLPVAGLMTNLDAQTTAKEYEKLNAIVHSLGSPLRAPFMTLSFMALPVIPSLKMTDKGLFDVDIFNFSDVVEL